MNAPPSSSLGSIGAYRLLSSLGRGGMGEVFLAWDERLNRNVAIKRIRPERSVDGPTRARFRREAQAVARLSHPAIVQIFDVLETEDGDCIVMEHVEGSSLATLIGTPEIDIRATVQIAADVAAGLGHAHEKGLIHRDLKPENVIVMVEATGLGNTRRAKILDFGLARALAEDVLTGESTALTESGAIVGTAHAMSPEQAAGREVDHRSDLFALGTLLYQMLTGVSPFRGQNMLDSLRRVASEAPQPVETVRPGLPSGLGWLTMSLLEKDPAHRPRGALEVAGELRRIEAELTLGTAVAVVSREQVSREHPADSASNATAEFDGQTELLTNSGQAGSMAQTVVRTLVLTDLVDSTRLVENLGDARSAEVFARHDRTARDLLAQHHGLEIDKADGFLLLFDRPIDGIDYALDYQQSLMDLSHELGLEIKARIAAHLGEVVLRRNTSWDVARGAKPVEVEGLAKAMTARLVSLAMGNQILLTRGAFDLARRAAQDGSEWVESLHWLAHGSYLFKGVDEAVEVFEVGREGLAPLTAPEGSEKARRGSGEEVVLGWRPAAGLPIPRRPNWTLVERLGEGGFGEVWLARHKSDEQRVFKFCFEAARLRSLKREVTLFRVLKKALGNRDDIARIIDWSFEEAPYFLESEYTEGGNLAVWADENGGLEEIPLSTRLELIAQVAEALSAAHSVGILHKDVKPGNVLVTNVRDGLPRIRLTDFGIGLLTNDSQLLGKAFTIQGMTETSAATGEGTRMYMAPEQLEGKPASVQADIYSLGVMLYQVVMGDFSRALAPGWRRDIDDELLADDIAYFVDGHPERRAESALEIAKRLRSLGERRDMQEAAVRAQEEAEEARRSLAQAQQRRRLATAVAAVALVALAVVGVFALRERQARQLANREAETSRRVTDFLVGLFGAADPFGRDASTLTVREILDQGTEKVREELNGEPEIQATMMHTMANAYGSLNLFNVAVPLATDAVDARRQYLGADEPATADSLYLLGKLLCRQGNFDDGTSHLKEALDLRRRSPAEGLPIAEALQGLGHYCFHLGGRYDEAEVALREALDIRRVLLDPKHLDLAESQHTLALLIADRGDFGEAEPLLRGALSIKREALGRHPEVTDLMLNLARMLWLRREHSEAEGLAREALEILTERLGPNNMKIASGLNILGGILHQRGERAEAEKVFRRSLSIREEHGDTSFRKAADLQSLAWLLFDEEQYENAEKMNAEALALLEGKFPETSYQIALSRSLAGACLNIRGDAAAENLLLKSYAVLQAVTSDESPPTRATLRWIVQYYESEGLSEKATEYKNRLAL